MYDATLGRFLQRDPAGPAGGADLYLYAADNPATYSDASGLLTMDACKEAVKKLLGDKVDYEEKTNGDTHFFTIKGWKANAQATTPEEKLIKYLLENRQDRNSKLSPHCLIGMICQKCSSSGLNGKASPGGWITFYAAQTGGWGGKLDTVLHELIHAYDYCKPNFEREGDCKKALLMEIRAYRYADQCKDATSCFARAQGSATSKHFSVATGRAEASCTEQEIAQFSQKKDELYKEALQVPVLDFPTPKSK
jgi:hypothetical protein